MKRHTFLTPQDVSVNLLDLIQGEDGMLYCLAQDGEVVATARVRWVSDAIDCVLADNHIPTTGPGLYVSDIFVKTTNRREGLKWLLQLKSMFPPHTFLVGFDDDYNLHDPQGALTC